MKTKKMVRKSAGFTLVETLATTAVLVILMALTFVAIFTYKKHLDITELDNAAREIYMAAQNRAVLLKNRDRLEELVENSEYQLTVENPDGSTTTLYYVSSDQIKAMEDQELLPEESIESSLWSGFFYIVYETQSGSVTDVFYAEKSISGEGFKTKLYAEYKKMPRDERMNLVPMVGYYGGTSSETGDAYIPRTPMLRIINDNELTVEVTCWLPTELADAEEKNVQLNLVLNYGEQNVELYKGTLYNLYTFVPAGEEQRIVTNKREIEINTDVEYYKYTFAYLLDSLKDGKQFKDLGERTTGGKWTIPPGRNFTVTAEIEYTGSSRLINGTQKTATDNSLFATSTTGNTAHIACMRHLQNLDTEFSYVDKYGVNEEKADENAKYFAIQIADIENIEIKEGTPYNFIPINNTRLVLYDGSDHSIYNLYENWSDKDTLGLFGTFWPSNSDTEGFFGSNPDYRDRGLHNIHLVNASIYCGDPEYGYVGALSGVVLYADIVNCSVYWTPEKNEDLQDIRKKLGMTSYDEGYKLDEYKIKAIGTISYVGGLVGMMSGMGEATEASVSNCFVATTINGSYIVGGLVGSTANVKIENSYADCYIQAKNAAGLVGEASDFVGYGFELINCFATGYISVDSEVDSKSAGLGLLGGTKDDNKINVKNSYAAIAYNKPDSATPEKEKGEIQKRYPLVPVGENVNIENSYYLYSPYVNNDLYPEWMASFDQLSDGSVSQTLCEVVNAETGELVFAKKPLNKLPSPPDEGGTYYTHPYNLQDGIELENYPFPAFGDSMPQYGDWPEANQKGYLVYWEQYNDGAPGVEGSIGVKGAADEVSDLPSDLPKLKDATDTNALVVNDGYAVYLPAEFVPAGADTITIRFERSYKTSGGDLKNEVAEMTYGLNLTSEDASHVNLIQVKSSDGTTTYYLAPLPEDWVGLGSAASGDFYQKLHIVVENSTNPTTYFFNPHFASTVISADYMAEKPDESLAKNISVRSPRHLYELSNHSEYFHNSDTYAFNQELNLDYSQYTGYGLFTAGGGDMQPPIGHEDDIPFNQTYDGGCHTIINVPLQTSGCSDVGLFGCNEGTIQKVVFLGNGVIDRKTGSGSPARVISGTSAELGLNIGALVGHNGKGGKIDGCAVAYIALSINGTGAEEVRCGGLVGYNEGSISGSAATLDSIGIGGSGSATYVGGLVGRNDTGATISSCYAIGRMVGSVVDASGISVGGFAGFNSGSLNCSYTAYDLTTAYTLGEKYAFCPAGGSAVKCYYLNNGSFTYLNGNVFQAEYVSNGVGEAQTWEDLTAEAGTVAKLNGGSAVFGAPGANKYAFSGEKYVFPAVVTDAMGAYVHYGDWPLKVEVKNSAMGVFYWEKELIEGKEEYHFSAIVIDPVEGKAHRLDNLCKDHDDKGVITEYGYGYFGDNSDGATLTFTPPSDRIMGFKEKEDTDGALNGGLLSLLDGLNKKVTFVKSYITTSKEEASNHSASTYLLGDTGNGNGYTFATWNLGMQKDGKAYTYDFDVNPFFAEAFSLKLPSDNSLVADAEVMTKELGTNDVPFGIRSVEQLQYINWNWQEKRTDVVAECNEIGRLGVWEYNNTNCKEFTFLSHSIPINSVGSFLSGYTLEAYRFIWKQSHDICGNGEIYTPIAAFKGTTEKVLVDAYLSAWFGGEYDGGNYRIQDLNIAADQSNCVGLFGVAMNATLKNIVMSTTSKGNGMITGRYAGGRESWYAVGGLVGLAASCDQIDGAPTIIDNCAIAGYKIMDEHKGLNGTVGGAGGLVGMGNALISGCSAVTEIEVDCTFATNGCNIYVGGIVGTSQQSIEYCYAGGSIALGTAFSLSRNNLAIGGLQGGGSAKTLNVGTSSRDSDGSPVIREHNGDDRKGSISNSYSYVTLPVASGSGNLTQYAVGDASSYVSCIYLDSAVTGDVADKDEMGVSPCSYEELSGEGVLSQLNSAATGKQFAYLKGDNGLHSYPHAEDLKGMDYPFPAIHTVGDAAGTGSQYVHYGDWPTAGELPSGTSIPSGDVSGGDNGPSIESEGIVSGGNLGPEIFDESVSGGNVSNRIVSGGDWEAQ